MDNNIKKSLVLAGTAIAGGYSGTWVAQRVCTAMGCTLGPWGSAIGAMLGAMASTAVAQNMMGDNQALPEFEPEAMNAVAANKE